jgi:hypothetical protein
LILPGLKLDPSLIEPVASCYADCYSGFLIHLNAILLN